MSHVISPNRSQQLLLPPSIDEWVPASHPARFVDSFVDAIAPQLEIQHGVEGTEGRPRFDRVMLLKLWVYGWMERVRSSRQIERACYRDLAFVWLTGNLHPDHNTLWRFFKDNREALKKVFTQCVRVAVKAELVGFVLHAVDGTKLSAACSMETAHHRKKLQEALAKLDAEIASSMKQIEAAESTEQGSHAMPETLKDSKARRAKIADALAEVAKEDVEHLHPTEPEARTMKTRGGAKVLGYNSQAVVDQKSDLIVGANVSNDATDHGQLVEMIEKAAETTGEAVDATVADKGYHSGEQIDRAEKRRLPIYTPPQEESAKGPYAKSKFHFDRDKDVYVCPRGQELARATTTTPDKTKDEKVAIYRCPRTDCPDTRACSTAKLGRTIKRSSYEDAVERHAERLASEDGREAVRHRKAIVEHTFGALKHNDGFRRFTVRGLDGARTQWALICAAYNLRKLAKAWQRGELILAA